VGWDSASIRDLFEAKGLLIQQWDKVQTDMLTIVPSRFLRKRWPKSQPASPSPTNRAARIVDGLEGRGFSRAVENLILKVSS